MKSKAVYLLSQEQFEVIYGPDERADIAKLVDIVEPLIASENFEKNEKTWPEVEMIFSGWGMVKVDEVFLKRFPKLKVIFYGAGSVKGFVTDAMWDRGIKITSAYAGNAVPVCEFALSQILFGLKQGWQEAAKVKKLKTYPPRHVPAGGYKSTVGLLSLGMIGRMVAERLKTFDVKVIAYDPFATQADAEKLGLKLATLEEVFAQSDVVSCHTPWLKETEKLIKAKHFESMKKGATFLNTARGAVVDEEGMIEVLRRRPDLMAVLDVTYPEPPVEDSPLYTLDNVVITPHIAGSMGNECRRMGRYMVQEVERYLAGQPLKFDINKAKAAIMA